MLRKPRLFQSCSADEGEEQPHQHSHSVSMLYYTVNCVRPKTFRNYGKINEHFSAFTCDFFETVFKFCLNDLIRKSHLRGPTSPSQLHLILPSLLSCRISCKVLANGTICGILLRNKMCGFFMYITLFSSFLQPMKQSATYSHISRQVKFNNLPTKLLQYVYKPTRCR